jgi:hypothetical protein
MKSINQRLADLFNTFKNEREECKDDLINSIDRHRADSDFTTASFNRLQLAESALRFMGFITAEWLETEEFKNLTQEEVVDMVQNYINEDLTRQENRFFKDGLNPKNMSEASGAMQVKQALMNLLARTK